jgi:predicted nucleic acid-binding protein
MAIVIALGIAVAVVAFVAAPFFLRVGASVRAEKQTGSLSPELEELLAEKETLYGAIEELDFDAKSGKLSGADHRALRQRYEERAAVVLKTIDAVQGAAGRSEASRKPRREKRRG